MRRKQKTYLSFTLLTVMLVALFITDIVCGATYIPFNEIFNAFLGNTDLSGGTNSIIFYFRIPKAVVALLAGMALSVSGLQMQTVFRNPLADPFVLGISSGASLGVALFLLGFSSIAGWGLLEFVRNVGTAMAAWIGAGGVLILVLLVSSRVRDIMSVLILGFMFGAAVSSIVTVLQYFSSDPMLKSYVIWTMGSLGGVSINQLYLMAAVIIIGILISLFSIKMLNALQLGDNYARSMGLNVRQARNVIFVSTSLLAGTVTAFCGPIGFIGIAIPHIARMIFREADHRFLLPIVMLLGANIMLFCDILSQVVQIKTNQPLPISTVTALLGIPVIIFVIIRHQKLL